MNVLNHAAVGAAIALVVKQPALALPLAFLSHFVLDTLPHYGVQGDEGYEALFRQPRSFLMATIDFIGVLVLIVMLFGQPWYVYLSALIATSPDLIWLYRYFGFERYGKKPPKAGPITKFHQKIQWCERSWGMYIEIPLSILLLGIIWILV